jgi:hypothetical protein
MAELETTCCEPSDEACCGPGGCEECRCSPPAGMDLRGGSARDRRISLSVLWRPARGESLAAQA